MYYLGIDPGLDGALALYSPAAFGGKGSLVVKDMPTHEIITNRKKKRTINLHALRNILSDLKPFEVTAIIEHVHALPKQGVTSSFNFGFHTACVHMGLACTYIPFKTIAPVVWKRVMGISANKMEARMQASRLLPEHAHQWPLKKHDGRAEAALLAFYLAHRDPDAPKDRVEDIL